MKKQIGFIIFFIFFLLTGATVFASNVKNELDRVDFAGTESKLEILFHTNHKSNFSSYFLKQPERFVVELFNTSVSNEFKGFHVSSPFVYEISGNFQDLDSSNIQIVFHLSATISYSFHYEKDVLHLTMIPIDKIDRSRHIENQPESETPIAVAEHHPDDNETITTPKTVPAEEIREDSFKQKQNDLKKDIEILLKNNQLLSRQLKLELISQNAEQKQLDSEYMSLLEEERRYAYDQECLKLNSFMLSNFQQNHKDMDIEQRELDTHYASLIEEEQAYSQEQKRLNLWKMSLAALENTIQEQNRMQELLDMDCQRICNDDKSTQKQIAEAQKFAEISQKQDLQQERLLLVYEELQKDDLRYARAEQERLKLAELEEQKRQKAIEEEQQHRQAELEEQKRLRDEEEKQQQRLAQLEEQSRLNAEEERQKQLKAEQQRLAQLEEQKRLAALKKEQEKQKLESLPVKKLKAPPKVATLRKLGFHPSQTGASVKISFSSEVDMKYEWLSDYELAFIFTPSKITSRMNLLPLQTQAFGKNVLQIRPSMRKKDLETVITIDLMYKTAFKVIRNKNEFELFFGDSP